MPKNKDADSSANSGKPKSNKKIVICTVILAIILSAGAYVSVIAAKMGSYDKIFPNVYISDIALAGKTADEALALLDSKYSSEKVNGVSVELVCRDTKTELPLSSLSIEFHNREAVANALSAGDSKNRFLKAIAFIGQKIHSVSLDPVFEYDTEAFEAAINAAVSQYETEPVGFTFEIKPTQVTLHGEVNGIKADRAEAALAMENQITAMSFDKIVLEPKETSPEPLNFDKFYKWLTADAENAYYEKNDNDKVVVHPEKLKCIVDKSVVKNAIDSIKASSDNTAVFDVTTEQPEITAEFLQQNLYIDKLGSYSTHYSGSAARVSNVQLATGRIDGYELLPDEEFSYDKTILPRNSSNGYRAAPVYVGNKVESGMGGGICQPSSTLYCAALYANLEILERHNHSLMVSYLPPGLDATIAEGVLDLRFKNSTGYPVKISSSASGGIVTFTIWGYNPEHYSAEILRSGGGYNYYVTRVVKKDGAEVKREQMTSSKYNEHEDEKPEKKPEQEKPKENNEKQPAAPANAPAHNNPAPEQPAAAEPKPEPAEPAPQTEQTPAPAPRPADDTAE